IAYYGTPMVKTTALQTLPVLGGATYTINVVAIDTTNDGVVNYDTLIFYDPNNGGILTPSSPPPNTGPAIVKASAQQSQSLLLVGSPNQSNVAYYVSTLAPDLSTVHIAQYTVTDIPTNANVQNSVNDINNNVGSWGHAPDFFFTERLFAGVANFAD